MAFSDEKPSRYFYMSEGFFIVLMYRALRKLVGFEPCKWRFFATHI